MDRNQIVHDLTIALVSAADNCKTPESIVSAYNELLPKVAKAYDDCKSGPRKARVLPKRDLFE